MKPNYRLLWAILVLVLCFSTAGCTSIEFDIEETINPPQYDRMAVQGTWKIDRFISAIPENKDTKINIESIKNKYLDQWAIFDSELGAVGTDTCVKPRYRVIRTTADSFIQSKYRIDGNKLGLGKQDISVVNVSSDNQLFYEIILTDEKTAYVYIDNGFLALSKTSDKVDAKLKEKSLGNVGQNVSNGQYEEDPLLRSGILIGIRAEDNSYRTLWIYSKNREVKTVSGAKQLLLPRAKGFWQVGVINENNIDAIYAEPFIERDIPDRSIMDRLKGNILKISPETRITFLGNDYIGTGDGEEYRVYPVETLKEGKAALFPEINNEYAGNVYEQAANNFITSLKGEAADKAIKKVDEMNFTLARRNGHWILKSRLYFQQPYEKEYQDFDLKLMVPSRLIHYDEMNIQWNDIKSKLPWTSDAFMSPNKDIAVLVDGNSLSLYTIKNSSNIGKQLLKIQLAKGETIVMAEWSIGRYADIWDNFVGKIFTADNSSGYSGR
ncbi:hypothetical protein [Ruminiclostridium cellobioparum]|uniref:hypothetical protein n=1 Tax=Ruminiclostridium cellobioparum TaxID=29355 RepID=UPI0006869056|nr:hypothetical protein [Ruminiclostridium cellobioparum]